MILDCQLSWSIMLNYTSGGIFETLPGLALLGGWGVGDQHVYSAVWVGGHIGI